MARHPASDVRYDPETHTSSLPDGTDVPHVTAILAAVGVSTDFERLSETSPRIAQHVARGRLRGTAVHEACHYYDDNDLDLPSLDPQLVPWLGAWVRVRREKRLHPVRRERHLFHDLHQYAGIEDGVFLCGDLRVLVDIKTGDPEDAAAHLQTAAYAEADERMHPGERIDQRWAVWLRPTRRTPYTIINYTARRDALMDFSRFLACLTVYYQQPARRARVA